MTDRTVRLMTVCLALAACGGERPEAGPADGMPMAGMHGGAAPQAATAADPRAALFVRKGCPQCHSISALAVKSPSEIGPDLTLAYSDVRSRFNMELEEFLEHPTGTMQVVLSSQITLSGAERDSIVHILKELHEEAEDGAQDNKDD